MKSIIQKNKRRHCLTSSLSKKSRKLRNQRNKKKIRKTLKTKKIKGGGYGGSSCAAPDISKGLESSKKSLKEEPCLTNSALNKIITYWNQYVKKNNKNNFSIDCGENKSSFQCYKALIKQLESFYGKDKLPKEHQWIDSFVWIKQRLSEKEKKEIKDLYAPMAPRDWLENPNEWLSTIDINEVLKDYEDKFKPKFKSFGAVPIDFKNCQVSSSLCSIQLSDLKKKNVVYIGIVFNLDKSYQPGSHWIALFVNILKGELNYWDSYGASSKVPTEVEELMNKLSRQGKEIGIDFKKQYNKIRHQYGNSECGVYCIHFIVRQLYGASFKSVCENRMKDSEIEEYRRVFFNIPSPL